MARSARPVEAFAEEPGWFSTLQGVGGFVLRNPGLVGGTTAFLVAFSFVSANALWYQPHVHSGPFFATRTLPPSRAPEPAPSTTIRIERPIAPEAAPAGAVPDTAAAMPAANPRVLQVQSVLRDLKFYDGPVDGLTGPATRAAVAAYQKALVLPQSGQIDDALLVSLGIGGRTGAIAPVPQPAPAALRQDNGVAPAEPAADERVRIQKIQAGLKAFGNEAMQIDGVLGGKTRAAIREFQALFGLPETGEPDQAVYAKMREIGLTD